ncbi:MAG: DUF134 domain-containing protein [Candidatus Pacebacteria bacterium]|nr:DUF134 domain-containing protein [Candidatus Paceibacterota bacterium]
MRPRQKNRVGRPCLKRQIEFDPKITYFKPRGVNVSSLEIIELSSEELEAVRLKNLKEYNQSMCAKKMHTSPATIQRILEKANKKIAEALIEGKAIKIIKNYDSKKL